MLPHWDNHLYTVATLIYHTVCTLMWYCWNSWVIFFKTDINKAMQSLSLNVQSTQILTRLNDLNKKCTIRDQFHFMNNNYLFTCSVHDCEYSTNFKWSKMIVFKLIRRHIAPRYQSLETIIAITNNILLVIWTIYY